MPTPNWDALATLDAAGAVTRADVIPQIVDRLTVEAADAKNTGDAVHHSSVLSEMTLSAQN